MADGARGVGGRCRFLSIWCAGSGARGHAGGGVVGAEGGGEAEVGGVQSWGEGQFEGIGRRGDGKKRGRRLTLSG